MQVNEAVLERTTGEVAGRGEHHSNRGGESMKRRHPIDSSHIGRRDFLKVGAATAASSAIAPPAIAQPRFRSMRFGHMLPPDTVYHKAILLFADEVNKNSGGKMK